MPTDSPYFRTFQAFSRGTRNHFFDATTMGSHSGRITNANSLLNYRIQSDYSDIARASFDEYIRNDATSLQDVDWGRVQYPDTNKENPMTNTSHLDNNKALFVALKSNKASEVDRLVQQSTNQVGSRNVVDYFKSQFDIRLANVHYLFERTLKAIGVTKQEWEELPAGKRPKGYSNTLNIASWVTPEYRPALFAICDKGNYKRLIWNQIPNDGSVAVRMNDTAAPAEPREIPTVVGYPYTGVSRQVNSINPEIRHYENRSIFSSRAYQDQRWIYFDQNILRGHSVEDIERQVRLLRQTSDQEHCSIEAQSIYNHVINRTTSFASTPATVLAGNIALQYPVVTMDSDAHTLTSIDTAQEL